MFTAEVQARVAALPANQQLAANLRSGGMTLKVAGPTGRAVRAWRRDYHVRAVTRVMQAEWEGHLQEWHAYAMLASQVLEIMQGHLDGTLCILKFLLPLSASQVSNGIDTYLVSCGCIETPALALAGCATSSANSSRPLPLRAFAIAKACYRASLGSPGRLKVVLREVLPIAPGVEWLYRYCVFLATQHRVSGILGMHLIQTSMLGGGWWMRMSAKQHSREQQAREQRWIAIRPHRASVPSLPTSRRFHTIAPVTARAAEDRMVKFAVRAHTK
jgi:hypothetical protein